MQGSNVAIEYRAIRARAGAPTAFSDAHACMQTMTVSSLEFTQMAYIAMHMECF